MHQAVGKGMKGVGALFIFLVFGMKKEIEKVGETGRQLEWLPEYGRYVLKRCAMGGKLRWVKPIGSSGHVLTRW